MTNDTGNKISVCLITYNHVELIESTLQSILDQSLEGYEVIVSDDCSTDGTWERILEVSKRDARIRPIRTPRNLGMAGNANYAVSNSTRPYIALLHHDDLYRRDLLEKWSSVLEKFPKAAFCFNAYSLHGSDTVIKLPFGPEPVDGEWFLRKYLLPNWGCVVRGTAMIRRDAWIQLAGMREQFGLLADVDLWMRLARNWAVAYVREPVIAIRQQRPSYYPNIYTGVVWSWKRQLFMYDIHATNRLEYYNTSSLSGRLRWLIFRTRLSFETTKWLVYAVLRNKPDMILSSRESQTRFDLLPLRALRRGLRWAYAGRNATPEART